MSLLLDALKRAEQEKHTRNGERPPPARSEPARTPTAANSPSGGLELAPVVTPGAGAPRSESAAHAAQVVFQAKTARAEAESGRGVLWATIGVIIVVVAAAGAYVWYSLSMLTPQLQAAAAVRPAPPPAPAPGSQQAMTVGELAATSPAPTRRAPAEAPSAEAAPRDPRKEAPVPRTTETIVGEILGTGAAAAKPAPAPAPTAPASPATIAAAATLAAPAAPLTFAPRGESAARVPAEVSSGYEALRSGDLESARRAYQAALARDPRSLDGNLGMATIEARSGNRPVAASHYRKVLEIDPHNSTALAGLAGMADFARVEGMEARLLEDIARQPRSAPLHFALGNMFASQSRWHDAQAAYFEAYRLDPVNPDIAYNLAVSLDHLGQGRLAAEHYRRALEAGSGQAIQFDAGQVRRRLAELAPGGER